jgi:nucleoside-triphosphatase THEP1
MIQIITGVIDAGKTSYLKRHYDKHRNGDGVISIKYMPEGKFVGYDLLHLKTGETIPFIREKGATPRDWKQIYEVGRYSFSMSGFAFAGNILDGIEEDPVYLDEIGPLEVFHNQGFHTFLMELIEKKEELFLGVRYSLLEDMIKKYINNKEMRVITV